MSALKTKELAYWIAILIHALMLVGMAVSLAPVFASTNTLAFLVYALITLFVLEVILEQLTRSEVFSWWRFIGVPVLATVVQYFLAPVIAPAWLPAVYFTVVFLTHVVWDGIVANLFKFVQAQPQTA